MSGISFSKMAIGTHACRFLNDYCKAREESAIQPSNTCRLYSNTVKNDASRFAKAAIKVPLYCGLWLAERHEEPRNSGVAVILLETITKVTSLGVGGIVSSLGAVVGIATYPVACMFGQHYKEWNDRFIELPSVSASKMISCFGLAATILISEAILTGAAFLGLLAGFAGGTLGIIYGIMHALTRVFGDNADTRQIRLEKYKSTIDQTKLAVQDLEESLKQKELQICNLNDQINHWTDSCNNMRTCPENILSTFRDLGLSDEELESAKHQIQASVKDIQYVPEDRVVIRQAAENRKKELQRQQNNLCITKAKIDNNLIKKRKTIEACEKKVIKIQEQTRFNRSFSENTN